MSSLVSGRLPGSGGSKRRSLLALPNKSINRYRVSATPTSVYPSNNHWRGLRPFTPRLLPVSVHVLYATQWRPKNREHCWILNSCIMGRLSWLYNGETIRNCEYMKVLNVYPVTSRRQGLNKPQKSTTPSGIFCGTTDVVWCYARYLLWCDGMPLQYDCHTYNHTQKQP